MTRKSAVSFALLLALFGAACASPSPGAPSQAAGPTSVAKKKQIVAAILSDPAVLHQEMTNPSPAAVSVPGLAELFVMMNGALTYLDGQYVRKPWLADAVPSVDNGLW